MPSKGEEFQSRGTLPGHVGAHGEGQPGCPGRVWGLGFGGCVLGTLVLIGRDSLGAQEGWGGLGFGGHVPGMLVLMGRDSLGAQGARGVAGVWMSSRVHTHGTRAMCGEGAVGPCWGVGCQQCLMGSVSHGGGPGGDSGV